MPYSKRDLMARNRDKGSCGQGAGSGEERPATHRWFIFILVMAIGVVILSGPLFVGRQQGGEIQAQGAKETYQGIAGHVYTLEPFLVNLSDTDPVRYLKVRVDIESTEKKQSEEFAKRLPQLRDAIITVLSSKKFNDIYDSEGKKKLKEEIIAKLNQSLSQMRVRTIYFTEFVVQ